MYLNRNFQQNRKPDPEFSGPKIIGILAKMFTPIFIAIALTGKKPEFPAKPETGSGIFWNQNDGHCSKNVHTNFHSNSINREKTGISGKTGNRIRNFTNLK